MPYKRKRVKNDPDVIKTARDFRRATGDGHDDDFEEADEPKINLEQAWTDINFSRYKRAKLRESMPKAADPFPFLNLPAEIRNMVYRYLVVSKSPTKIRLDLAKDFTPGGIDTTILLANRQVYNEAADILYNENKCVATVDRCHWKSGLALRVDDPKTKNQTSRYLRSGRSVDMVKYRGLIYQDVIQRLRHIDFVVELFDRSLGMCDHITMHLAWVTQSKLYSLMPILHQRIMISKKDIEHGRDWKIVINSPGLLGLRVLRKILEPISYSSVPTGIRHGKIEVALVGKFPQGWENKLFPGPLYGDGLVTAKAESVDTKKQDVGIKDLERYFDRYGEEVFW